MTALAPVRITFRLHRFEAVAFGLATAALVALVAVVAARLDAVGYGPACVDAARLGAATPPGCEFKANVFYGISSGEGGIVAALIGFVPYLAAMLLGVAVVGREIERGTTRLAWALAPSRMTWLAQRLMPVLVFLAAVGLTLGLGADRLLAARNPGLDPSNALDELGSRGPVLAARILFVFGVALAAGALLGRALPALIVAAFVASVGLWGGTEVHDRMIRAEAVEMADVRPGDRYVDQRFRLPDGRVIGWDEVERYDPIPTDPNTTAEWPTLPQVNLAVPGTRYGEIERREVAALAGGTLVALAITALAVRWRRPG